MANKNNSNKNKKTSQGPSKSGSTSKKKTADNSKVSQASQKSTSSKPSKNSKGKVVSKKKKIIKRVFLALLFLFLALFVIGLGYVFAIISSAPPLDVDAVKNLSQASVLYDRDGEFMDNVHSDIDRQIVDGDKIPKNLKNAFVSIEDERFYKHPGIDARRILGSAVTDVVKIFKGQRGLHGGSTLTQQLLKNTILSNEDFIVERKIKEIYLALQLEKHLDKDAILVQYLNTIPLGGVTYGVEAASNLYFGKSVDQLNLIQCAYIAGVTQAPHTYSAYNPIEGRVCFEKEGALRMINIAEKPSKMKTSNVLGPGNMATWVDFHKSSLLCHMTSQGHSRTGARTRLPVLDLS